MNSSALIFLYGGEGVRTPDLRLAKPALCQLSYAPSVSNFKIQTSNPEFEICPNLKFERVGLSRFELLTSRLSGVRSNQLSYRPSGSLCRKIKPLGLLVKWLYEIWLNACSYCWRLQRL